MSAVFNYLKEQNIKFENIRELCSNRTLNEIYPKLNVLKKNKYFTIILDNEESFEYIFKNKIRLKLYTADKSFIEKSIDCYQEIVEFIKLIQLDINDILINNNKHLNLNQNISHLDNYLENDILQLNEIILKVPIISIDKVLFNLRTYLPLRLSEYFYDYFPYEDKTDLSKIKYYESQQRKEIEQNIYDLHVNKDLRKYKLTGPTSNGKSFTFFFLSRCHNNMMYINLKVIKNKEKEKEKLLKIIISELSRLSLTKE